MKKFILIKKLSLLRLSATLALGLIVGAALVLFLIGAQIDQLYMENEGLKHELIAFESEMIELRESLQERKYVVISVEPIITFTKDKLTSYDKESYGLEITKIVKELLSSLKGKEIKDIDYFLVPEVLENRVVQVEDTGFVLNVTTVIFSQKVLVYINAREQK